MLIFSGCNDSSSSKIEVKKPTEKQLIAKITQKDINTTVVKEVKQVIKKKKKRISPTKERFKKIMVPIIQEVYIELEKQYHNIKEDIKLKRNLLTIEKLKKQYKVKDDKLLLHALKPHPVSIVLAQSAIESGWLNSRFAKDANNIFGVWSFDKNEPRIAAIGSRSGKTIYLKKYDSYKEAVRDYYKSIAKSWAYKDLRYLRTVTNKPEILLPHFKKYSEKGYEYIEILRKLIKNNEFEKYDIKEVDNK